VIVQAGAPSGVAIITVDDAAENTIIVVPGANGLLGHDDVVRLEQALERANVLLLQLEIPLEAVVAAARVARKHGVTVVLDPAPAQSLPDELYTLTDIITPNETEAEALVGFPVHNLDDAERAARILCERGAQAAIIKMGSRGAYWRTSEGGRFEGAFQVHAIDTVAAGDAFNGGLATALSEGLPLEQAVRWGMAAGARSATRAGAQASMPAREEVFALLERFQLRC
jgi:ribokinase